MGKAAANGKFADSSSAASGSLVLSVRSTTPEYKGFHVSFASGTLAPSYACAGGGSIPLSRGCFKASFSVAAGDDFQTIRIPFSNFSDKWSPATGAQTKTCAEDKDVCPTAAKLAGIKRLEVWAEGADGKAHLEIQSITAEAGAESFPVTSSAATDTTFVTFDGAEGTSFPFKELNDPVMGGKSTGTVTLNNTGHFLVFDGDVLDVPALKAPGFIGAQTPSTTLGTFSSLTETFLMCLRSKLLASSRHMRMASSWTCPQLQAVTWCSLCAAMLNMMGGKYPWPQEHCLQHLPVLAEVASHSAVVATRLPSRSRSEANSSRFACRSPLSLTGGTVRLARPWRRVRRIRVHA